MMTAQTMDSANLLRRALQGNGIFSTVSGLVFVAAANSLATFTGIQPPLAFTVIGVIVLSYALLLFWQAGKQTVDAPFALFTIATDTLWVIVSWALILLDPLSLTLAGKWSVGLVAEAVFVFAVVQTIGYRRWQKA